MGESIVAKLQRDAIDESISIESLLRTAYLISRKLQLHDFEAWVSHELNGYKDKIPDYRSVCCETKAFNPFRGWVPIIMSKDLAIKFSETRLRMPISVLLHEYNSSKEHIAFLHTPEVTEKLRNCLDIPLSQFSIFVHKSELYRIISAVRNKILEWSIRLEETDIIGNDLTFSDDEIRRAKATPAVINCINNFYSSADGINIVQKPS